LDNERVERALFLQEDAFVFPFKIDSKLTVKPPRSDEYVRISVKQNFGQEGIKHFDRSVEQAGILFGNYQKYATQQLSELIG
jgi:hypothetical protein